MNRPIGKPIEIIAEILVKMIEKIETCIISSAFFLSYFIFQVNSFQKIERVFRLTP
jgi:hypothetical protein